MESLGDRLNEAGGATAAQVEVDIITSIITNVITSIITDIIAIITSFKRYA